MRALNYETDAPLKQIGVLLTRAEAEHLLEKLQAVLATGTGYARIEDEDWGELDISLYTPENMEFLHQRTRRLIATGE